MRLDWDRKPVWHTSMAALLLVGLAWIIVSRPASGAAASEGAEVSAREGAQAPNFVLNTLAGETVSLSDLRGQVVVLNFWASWCPPCRAEMPAIQQVYDTYREQGLVVLAVNVREPDSQTAEFVAEMQLTFPILTDHDGSVFETYRVRSLPTTFFIDREGVIQEMVLGGPMSRALIESQVLTLLEQGG